MTGRVVVRRRAPVSVVLAAVLLVACSSDRPDDPALSAPDPSSPGTSVQPGTRTSAGSDPPAGQALDDAMDDVLADLDPLPDAIPTTAADGRVAVLTDPTDRYAHGALGDAIEAGSITILAADGTIDEVLMLDPDVVESRLAHWVDADGDGTDDLLATVSNQRLGARVVVWSSAWGRIDGPPIGRRNRWRHVIGVVRAGPGAPALLIEVVMPHLTRTVTVSTISRSSIDVVRSRDLPIASHRNGSRELGDAFLHDADDDGDLDLVGPHVDGGTIAVDLATLEWTVDER